MAWQLTDNLADFSAAIRPLLDAEPERFTVLATVLDTLLRHGPNFYGDAPPVLAWWTQGSEVRAFPPMRPGRPRDRRAAPSALRSPHASAPLRARRVPSRHPSGTHVLVEGGVSSCHRRPGGAVQADVVVSPVHAGQPLGPDPRHMSPLHGEAELPMHP